MLMRMLCRMCRCFAEPEPSAKPDTDEPAEANGQMPDKNPKSKK
jgi:hypothetical protein